MTYTITHTCGCTRNIITRYGNLEASTVRFLTNSRCDVCEVAREIRNAKNAGMRERALDRMVDLTSDQRAEVLARVA